MASNDISVSAVPTRARFIVLAFLCSMAFVLYLDRVCIAQALVPMSAEFGFTEVHTKWILMAFTLSYGLFELPAGRLGDQFGARSVLTRIVIWWSICTALTGCVLHFSYEFFPFSISIVFNTLVLLAVVRFLFGAGEAGAIPNAARMLKAWFPLDERGRMQGFFQASMHVGGMVAPIVAALIIKSVGWRWSFFAFGVIGLIWASVFYWWFRDTPAQHPSVNAAELARIQPIAIADDGGHHAIPWRAAMRHPNLWFLGVIVSLTSFNSYLFFSWYSTYLQLGRGVPNHDAGYLSALVLAGMTSGALLGGVIADRTTRFAADRYKVRRRVALLVFTLAALSLTASVHAEWTLLSAFLCALAGFFMFVQQTTWWACTFEAAGKHTGTLFGLLNGVGIFGALGSQYFFGTFATWRREEGYSGRDVWDPAFYVFAGALLLAGILWQFMRERPAVGETQSAV